MFPTRDQTAAPAAMKGPMKASQRLAFLPHPWKQKTKQLAKAMHDSAKLSKADDFMVVLGEMMTLGSRHQTK